MAGGFKTPYRRLRQVGAQLELSGDGFQRKLRLALAARRKSKRGRDSNASESGHKRPPQRRKILIFHRKCGPFSSASVQTTPRR
jgi:hypothetical protein